MQELKETSSQDQLKRNRWEETTLEKSLKRQPERTSKFQTVSLADIAAYEALPCAAKNRMAAE